MERLKKLENVNEIPQAFQPQQIKQNCFLQDGVTIPCSKKTNIFSPIHIGGNPVLLGYSPEMNEEMVKESLQSSINAWDNGNGKWPAMTAESRIESIREFSRLMKEKRDEVCKMLMWEICKNTADAYKEFDRTIEYIEASCKELEKMLIEGGGFQTHGKTMAHIQRQPRGIVLCMGPSNYPLNETFTILIPALLMGNVVLFKPAKSGVLLLEPLLKCFEEAFPAGVVNTIYGDGATVIPPIMTSGKVDVFSFIGGTGTADRVILQHPTPHKMKAILGLGAKNLGVVLPNANIENAVKQILTGSLSYNGQRCTALKLLFIHQDVKEAFNQKFVEAVDQLKSGYPWEEGVQLTPLLPGQIDWINSLYRDALDKGAKVLNKDGGEITDKYFHPAVVEVTPEMKLYKEEQFGPLVPIVYFTKREEIVQYLENSPYGQQIAVFGGMDDKKTIQELWDNTKNLICRFNLNEQCQRGPDDLPFTARKDSAMGTLDVKSALLEFSIENVIAFSESETNNAIMEI